MDIEQFRDYCLAKKASSEYFPFGPETLVMRVGGKLFALTGLESGQFSVNLKCDPDKAVELREQYPEIQPGWHMNKKHWNTILVDGSVKDSLLREWVDHSYDLVAQALPRKLREQLNESQRD